MTTIATMTTGPLVSLSSTLFLVPELHICPFSVTAAKGTREKERMHCPRYFYRHAIHLDVCGSAIKRSILHSRTERNGREETRTISRNPLLPYRACLIRLDDRE